MSKARLTSSMQADVASPFGYPSISRFEFFLSDSCLMVQSADSALAGLCALCFRPFCVLFCVNS